MARKTRNSCWWREKAPLLCSVRIAYINSGEGTQNNTGEEDAEDEYNVKPDLELPGALGGALHNPRACEFSRVVWVMKAMVTPDTALIIGGGVEELADLGCFL